MTDRVEYIRESRAKYNAYDDEWEKAYFDEFSGGYVVYHKEHQFDPTIGKFGIPRGDYEKIASGVLVKYGMSVELFSEAPEYGIKIPDGLLNGKLFDIKGIEGTGKENILKDLKSANKKKAEVVVFYYHDKRLFSENQIRDNYHSYLRNSKSKRIQHVYYIVDRKLYTLK